MKKLTLEARVQEKRYNSVVVDLHEHSDSETAELLNWIEGVWKKEYAELKETKELVSEETWERYRVMNLTGLREQRLLKEAQSALRRAWDHPYRTEKQKARMAGKKAPNKHRL